MRQCDSILKLTPLLRGAVAKDLLGPTGKLLKGAATRLPGSIKGGVAGVAADIGEWMIPEDQRTVAGTILGHGAMYGTAGFVGAGPWGAAAAIPVGLASGAYAERKKLLEALLDPFSRTASGVASE